jgi:hypothetical protein
VESPAAFETDAPALADLLAGGHQQPGLVGVVGLPVAVVDDDEVVLPPLSP